MATRQVDLHTLILQGKTAELAVELGKLPKGTALNSPEFFDSRGYSLIHTATRSRKNPVEALDLLLFTHGVSPEVRSTGDFKSTPLEDVNQQLIDCDAGKAKMPVKKKQRMQEIQKVLITAHVVDRLKKSSDDIENAKIFASYCVKPDVKQVWRVLFGVTEKQRNTAFNGMTPLMYAVANPEGYSVAKYLLQNAKALHLDINKRGAEERHTVLHWLLLKPENPLTQEQIQLRRDLLELYLKQNPTTINTEGRAGPSPLTTAHPVNSGDAKLLTILQDHIDKVEAKQPVSAVRAVGMYGTRSRPCAEQSRAVQVENFHQQAGVVGNPTSFGPG